MHCIQSTRRIMHKANRLAHEAQETQETDKLADACIHAGNLDGFDRATRYSKSLRASAARLIEMLPICVC